MACVRVVEWNDIGESGSCGKRNGKIMKDGIYTFIYNINKITRIWLLLVIPLSGTSINQVLLVILIR